MVLKLEEGENYTFFFFKKKKKKGIDTTGETQEAVSHTVKVLMISSSDIITCYKSHDMKRNDFRGLWRTDVQAQRLERTFWVAELVDNRQ